MLTTFFIMTTLENFFLLINEQNEKQKITLYLSIGTYSMSKFSNGRRIKRRLHSTKIIGIINFTRVEDSPCGI